MRALRIMLWTLLGLLLAVLALIASLWWWTGSNRSLDTALAQVQRWLPADQQLQAEGVAGSLRSGGHIASLRWQQGALQVQARDIDIGWSWRALLDGELQLGRVQIAQLRIDDQRTSQPEQATQPAQPPTSLLLPLKVRASFGVDTLEWTGPPAFTATQLRGSYAFDGQQHALQLQQAQWSSGQYQGSAMLQATAPMALAVQLQGQLQTQLPSSTKPLQVQAQASLQGPLADAQAVLQFKAQLTPAANTRNGMQADVQAQITPWQAQPVKQAVGRWQALDLAALWPQAPRTLLTGSAQVMPQGAGWRGELQTRNTASGPWDKQQLPLESLQTKFVYLHGGWSIEQLQAQGAGGRITGQGQYNSGQWAGQASVRGVNPAAVHTQLAADSIDGDLSAKQGAAGIAFDARLQGRAQADAKSATLLQLKALQAKGTWRAPQLQLDTLRLETSDALLQGSFAWNMQSRATSAQLALSLPGATARVDGALSATQGQGQVTAQISDATLATRWLARWPGMPESLRTPLQGKADATLRWNGGWQAQGRQLRVQAQARTPLLGNLAAAPATRWQLRDAQADVDGSLADWKLRGTGKAEYDQLKSDWQTAAQGSYASDGSISVQLQQLKLGLQHSLRAGTWTAQLAEPVALQWKAGALELAPGGAVLTGPAPGTARLRWQTTRWAQKNTHTQLSSQGQLQGLPLAWLELLGQQQIANLGLRGDLLFDGQWDAHVDQDMRLRASLQRRSGDLQLLAEEGASAVAAGLREASLVLQADAERASARLRWDSENAGQVEAEFHTRLQYQGGGWTWAPDAPLAGKLSAQLPRVGVWSLLAPPGWRLRGTLDATATLSGTRAQPQWRGQLQAQDLALRSVVDGIDLSQGSLRVNLEGQRLEIAEFTLRGAGGATGGQLSLRGQAEWLADNGAADAGVASRLVMDLSGTADKLRVGTRPDQRLVVSGQLTAGLRQAKLQLRGALRADSALFILPDETAPRLDRDVIVRTSKPASTPGKNGAATPATSTARRIVPDIQIALDLGPDFQLQGQGLTTRLEGTLELRTAPDKPLQPRLTGVLRTALGSYKAYGQQLDIEEGTLRFTGPYDNPALDILAIRPNLQQRVGVQITGTAQSPAVRLYSEPDLPEAEKLSWLVLGRSAAEGGAETAMLQQAALALLAGNRGGGGGLAGAFGLDEVSVRGAANSDSSSGTNTGASLTLGKRLSRNFYVAYERSLAGTLGTFYIFYDLSRRFTLRAQTGEESAVDLIFTVRYD